MLAGNNGEVAAERGEGLVGEVHGERRVLLAQADVVRNRAVLPVAAVGLEAPAFADDVQPVAAAAHVGRRAGKDLGGGAVRADVQEALEEVVAVAEDAARRHHAEPVEAEVVPRHLEGGEADEERPARPVVVHGGGGYGEVVRARRDPRDVGPASAAPAAKALERVA